MTILRKGQRFGRWKVVSGERVRIKLQSYVQCRCDCGTKRMVQIAGLKHGSSTSCGCYKREMAGTYLITHGQARTPLYRNVWSGMIQRCYDEKRKDYRLYGGRGISVCREWRKDFMKFKVWAERAGYKPGLIIDRRNTNGNYTPKNCRFVTYEQNNNNKSNNRKETVFGETKNIKQWSRDPRCVVGYETKYIRVFKYGWTMKQAMTTPPYGKRI